MVRLTLFVMLFIHDCYNEVAAVNSLKSRLDKFWSMHDFVYDYRASPLAAGSLVFSDIVIS